jgi:shikimate dehydrogenase
VTGGRRAAVLGDPIAHSLSPALHLAAYKALGLEDWRYEAVRLTVDQLAGWVASRDQSWVGASVTMPLKHEALLLADHVEPMADLVGVANTLLFTPGGMVAANTDVEGIKTAIREGAPGIEFRDASILGGGATAVAAMVALAELGATSPKIFVRSQARAQLVVKLAAKLRLKPKFGKLGRPAADWVSDLVVSTLPPRAADPYARTLGHQETRGKVLLDVAYDPWPSQLARAWKEAGGSVISGKVMLLHQAAEQVRLMTGQPAPLQQMRRAIEPA